jgi:hypothetical protein
MTVRQETRDWLREWCEQHEQRTGHGPDAPEDLTSWAPVDLAAVIRDGHLDAPPAMLARADGPCLIYAEKNHVVSGEPEACKGWAALHLAAERVPAGEHVVYLDFEDVAATVIPRLLALGLEEAEIVGHFHYVQPDEPLGESGWAYLERVLALNPTLAVIDGVTEALVVHGSTSGTTPTSPNGSPSSRAGSRARGRRSSRSTTWGGTVRRAGGSPSGRSTSSRA